MPRIIRDDCIVDDDWQVRKLADGESAADVELPGQATLLPLAVWLLRRDELLARAATAGLRLGVWLDCDQKPEEIAADLEHLLVIGIHFPKFTDGRGYSIARLLRERYGFRGEVRAIGDVLQDQLFYMRRCGINAYALRADKSLERALAGLRVFGESYQAAVDQPLPLFRRRIAQEAT